MSAEPRDPIAIGVTLKLKDGQEHLLRRLGQALVLHWEEMPDGLQDVLIDQATMVTDREPASQSDIEQFIRTVKSVSVTN